MTSDHAIASGLDTTLSSGMFGDGDALAADRDTLVEGQSWALCESVPEVRPTSGLQALVRVAERADRDRAGAEVSFSPLELDGEAAGSPADDPTGPAPWADGRRAWFVRDWAHPRTDALLRVTRQVLDFSGYAGDIDGHTPARRDGEAVAAGVALLERALPAATGHTLSLVRLVCVLRCDIPSMYLTQVPETVFVSDGLLRGHSALVVGECLLHESLHEKYTLLRLVRRLMRPGQSDTAGPRVLLPWSLTMGERRRFGVNRLLSTLHVYAHLSALHVAVLATGAHREHHAEARARLATTYERGAYLAEALRFPEVVEHLGPDGTRLRDWLAEDVLAPAAAAGATAGLALAPYPTGTWNREDLVSP
ncbi:hypothetical protein [Streptomyces thermolilacinus]|uniref:Uncharacterized protein n=1 Tax=Streptomyces thermolilacinus SPC6 TaxID=1306406 RepID=A0A1D3DLG4_9ACTN|nr:hypothetical protein [Streptomyces thermolilacinus]OEJ93163.1 hypothetical protein J116_000300 [Streptomyces thermolilacinus SPC6]